MANGERQQIQFSFAAPTVIPQGDGSYLVKPGKPVVGRKMLTVTETARELAVTEQHVQDLIEEGRINAVNVGGGTRKFWRVPTGELERFMAERSSMK